MEIQEVWNYRSSCSSEALISREVLLLVPSGIPLLLDKVSLIIFVFPLFLLEKLKDRKYYVR
jgi:hypothetical protein